MKKLVSLLLSVGLLLSLAAPAAAVNEKVEKTITYRGISIVLDGVEISPCDENGEAVEPFIMDGSTYLPLRAVAQALGLGVEWLAESSTVRLSSGGEVVTGAGQPAASHGKLQAKLTYRDISVELDGDKLSLRNANGDSVEPFIYEGSTYLPLRVVGEALGLSVGWDGTTSTVSLLREGVSVERVVETLAMDAEGDMLLSTSETLTVSSPDSIRTIVYDGGGTKTESIQFLDTNGEPLSAEHYGTDGALIATETWEREGDYLHYTRDDLLDDGADSYIRYYYRDGRLHSAKEYGGSTLSKVHSTDHKYSYDDEGRLISHYIHIPDASWEEILYSYDDEGRLVRMDGTAYDIHSNGFTRYYTQYYYEGDLLVRSQDGGGSTTYLYGADGSLEKTVYARLDGKYLIRVYS